MKSSCVKGEVTCKLQVSPRAVCQACCLCAGDGQRLPTAGTEAPDPSLWDFASLNTLKPQLQSNRLAPAEAPKKELQKPMRSSRDEGWAHFPSVSQPSSAPTQLQAPEVSSLQPPGRIAEYASSLLLFTCIWAAPSRLAVCRFSFGMQPEISDWSACWLT